MPPDSNEPVRLAVGDPVPDMGWVDPTGERAALTQSVYAGRISVLFVCPSAAASGVAEALAGFRDLHDKFRALDVQVFAVTADPVPQNVMALAGLGLPFPMLSDAGFATGRALGLSGPGDTGPVASEPAMATLIVDPNRRVLRQIGSGPSIKHARATLSYCEKLAAGRKAPVVAMQAPVLIVPNVLDPAHCARLMRYWETGEQYEGGVANSQIGRNVPVKNVKVRGDVALPDMGAEAQELFGVFRRRLFPEIRKAHNFRVTRAETLRLGCYDAAHGGHFTAHRDDTTAYTAHRRFAMSLNLNTGEYEGGHLRFPEYGSHLYGPEAGGAVIFSCSLLHEATKVLSGRRFVLLGFFYGEAEQALRDKINAQKHTATPAPA